MKKVAVYGGAFDPPHNGHLHVVTMLQRCCDFDEIWLVPTGDREDKKQRASGTDRVAMCERLISNLTDVSVCDHQVASNDAPGTTLLFARFLRSKHPECDFSFVIGSELVGQLNTWRDAEALKEEVSFLVVPRPEFDGSLASEYNLEILQNDPVEISFKLSSSDVRELFSKGLDVQAYVPSLVQQYIKKEGLYGQSASEPILTVFQGKFLATKLEDSWEYVDRVGCESTVGVIAVFENQLVLVSQYRPPRKKNVIELPAGLVGDKAFKSDTVEKAAARELFEETGFKAKSFERLGQGPSTAGLSSEFTHLLVANEVSKAGEGGGDPSEDITVHLVELDKLENWLVARQSEGFEVDLKVYTAIYYCKFKK